MGLLRCEIHNAHLVTDHQAPRKCPLLRNTVVPRRSLPSTESPISSSSRRLPPPHAKTMTPNLRRATQPQPHGSLALQQGASSPRSDADFAVGQWSSALWLCPICSISLTWLTNAA